MTMIRDLTDDLKMPADSFAAIFDHHEGGYAVAWGSGYEAVAEKRAWDESKNTAEHGVVRFASFEEAERYTDSVRNAVKATWIPE